MMLKCHDCQSHLVAYLHGELPWKLRRRVAQHIQQCPLCYTAYAQHRDLARDLSHDVPLIGRESTPRFENVWAGVQADLARPKPNRTPNQTRYALAVLMLGLALMLPWTMGKRWTALAAVPTQPAPEVATATGTVGVGAPALGVSAGLNATTASAATPEAEPNFMNMPGTPNGNP